MTDVPESGGILYTFDIYRDGERLPVGVFSGHISVADTCVILPAYSRDMLIGLSSPLGRPMLAPHLSNEHEALKRPVKVHDVFVDLKTRLKSTPLDGHVVKIESKNKGRATWYAAVDELTDSAFLALADEGERIVRETTKYKGQRALDRRLEPFIALREEILDPEQAEQTESTHHLGVAVVSAGVLTLGTLATIALTKRNKN